MSHFLQNNLKICFVFTTQRPREGIEAYIIIPRSFTQFTILLISSGCNIVPEYTLCTAEKDHVIVALGACESSFMARLVKLLQSNKWLQIRKWNVRNIIFYHFKDQKQHFMFFYVNQELHQIYFDKYLLKNFIFLKKIEVFRVLPQLRIMIYPHFDSSFSI